MFPAVRKAVTAHAWEWMFPYAWGMELDGSMQPRHRGIEGIPGLEAHVLRKQDWKPVGTYRVTDTACRLQGSDGRVLFLKDERPEVPYACAAVAGLLYIAAPAIGRALWAGRTWMMQEWIPGTRTAFDWEMGHDERMLPPLETPPYREWRNRLMVLDAVISNHDRNPSNILIGHDAHEAQTGYFAIDMKMACDASTEIVPTSLPEALPEGMEHALQSWKEQGLPADGELQQLLSEERYRALCARRDAVLAWYGSRLGNRTAPS